MSLVIKTRYQSYKQTKGKTFSEPSKAIQSMRDGTFIESYLRKYQITGILGDPARRLTARYGDFADLPSFQESADRVAKTTQFFESLPSDIRKRFGNDVAQFVAFASSPENTKELVDLGILVRDSSTIGDNPDEVSQVSQVSPNAPNEVEKAQVKTE